MKPSQKRFLVFACGQFVLILFSITHLETVGADIFIGKETSGPVVHIPRIQGGEPVKVREPYYFLARILADFPSSRGSFFPQPRKKTQGAKLKQIMCTGAILTNEWVVTAAHCLFNKNGFKATNVTVRAGDISHTEFEGREVTRTATPYIYPYYSHVGRKNDIAMLKLDKPLPFNPFIGPIRMTNNTKIPGDGKEALTLAWGSKYSVEPLKPVYDREVRQSRRVTLKKALLETLDRKKCQQKLRESGAAWSFTINESSFCYSGKKEKVCFGDDGGPVIQTVNGEPVLVGINSFSRNKDTGGLYWHAECDLKVPTVATKVSYFFQKFIKPTILGIDVLSPDYYDPEE